jgi:predicted PurR-regulated permease PerM
MTGMRTRDDTAFIWLLVLVSAAFAWILWPFYGAILWATVAAILFAPLQRRLVPRMRGRRSPAALATLLIVLLIVILPLAFLSAALVGEAAGVYERMQSGEINFGRYFRQVFEALPGWATRLLDSYGLTDFEAVQEQISKGLLAASQFIAARALLFGQGTLDFVVDFFIMLYLLFFLLRDGDELVRRIREALPLRPDRRDALLEKFGIVIRATVKGNLVIAILQGALGGLIFWILGINSALLWAVLMAILSLLPAVGTALVWVPVAIYFLATGSVWQGVVLIAYGVLVIGLVDNVMRPILVGRDTKMPDYIVLVSTLGGLAIFGVNGFVVGPVIAALFIAAWDIYTQARREHPA